MSFDQGWRRRQRFDQRIRFGRRNEKRFDAVFRFLRRSTDRSFRRRVRRPTARRQIFRVDRFAEFAFFRRLANRRGVAAVRLLKFVGRMRRIDAGHRHARTTATAHVQGAFQAQKTIARIETRNRTIEKQIPFEMIEQGMFRIRFGVFRIDEIDHV